MIAMYQTISFASRSHEVLRHDLRGYARRESEEGLYASHCTTE